MALRPHDGSHGRPSPSRARPEPGGCRSGRCSTTGATRVGGAEQPALRHGKTIRLLTRSGRVGESGWPDRGGACAGAAETPRVVMPGSLSLAWSGHLVHGTDTPRPGMSRWGRRSAVREVVLDSLRELVRVAVVDGVGRPRDLNRSARRTRSRSCSHRSRGAIGSRSPWTMRIGASTSATWSSTGSSSA